VNASADAEMQPSPLLYSVGIGSDPMFSHRADRLAATLAVRSAIPSIYNWRWMVSAGGLGNRAPAFRDAVRRSPRNYSVRLLVLLIAVRVDVPKRIFTMKKIVIAVATLLITIPAFAGPPPSRHHGHHVMQAHAHMKTGQGPTYRVRSPNHYPIPNQGLKLMDPDRVTW
jgi:hypothetical protein